MELKEMSIDQFMIISQNLPTRTRNTLKASIKISDVPVENLVNISLQRYRHVKMLSHSDEPLKFVKE
jgi:hypothetical protein